MNERGFTLTELTVACAVIGVVMAGIFTLQQQGQLAYLWGSARVEVQQNARIALDVMTRELRSAKSVSACSTTSISFKDATGTDVSYSRSGASLPYSLLRNTDDIIGGLQSITITCYKADGYTTTTTAVDVRSVLIQIQTQVSDPGATASSPAGQQHAIVESRVRLRNL